MCDGTHSLIRITSSSDNRFQQLSSSQLSIRFGSKARPTARDSVLKHLVFGAATRSSGTPASCHCRRPPENFIRSPYTEIFTVAPPRLLWKSPPQNLTPE